MFSHVMVGATDLDASRKFYDAVLGTFGIPAGVTDETLNAAGITCRMKAMPRTPAMTWQIPPHMIPATARKPARRPPVNELANTNAMSRPGSSTTPATRRKNSQRFVA